MNLLEFVEILTIGPEWKNLKKSSTIIIPCSHLVALQTKIIHDQKTVSSQQIMQHKRNIRINENINNLAQASCDKSRIKKPELYRKRGYAWIWAYITAQAGGKNFTTHC